MRHFFVQLVRCLLFISIPACLFLLNYKYSSGISYLNHNSKPAPSLPPDKIHETSHNRRGPVKLVVVTCGKRLNGTLVNIKSAAAFTRAPLHLLLFADAANMKPLREEISEWPSSVLERVTYDVRQVNFPEDPKGKWKNLFQLCASQRLFLPVGSKHQAFLCCDNRSTAQDALLNKTLGFCFFPEIGTMRGSVVHQIRKTNYCKKTKNKISW